MLPLHRLIAVLIFCSFFNKSFCQNRDKKTLKRYDQIVGEKNIGLNNGILDLNRYEKNIVDNQNKFYKKNNSYQMGNVFYDGQAYYNKQLRYDLFNDVLLYNPPDAASFIGIDLIKKRVNHFELNGNLFVNLSRMPRFAKHQNFTGYWQKIQVNENNLQKRFVNQISPGNPTVPPEATERKKEKSKAFVLYLKHKKRKREILKNMQVYYAFDLSVDAYIVNHQTIIDLSDESAVSGYFLNQKEQIKGFYSKNSALSSEKPATFYRKLYQYITRNIKESK